MPNFGIQEYMRHTPETDAVFPHAYSFADGYLHPGEAPGLGVDLDENLAARYPYRAASLPVNRLGPDRAAAWTKVAIALMAAASLAIIALDSL